VNLGHVGVTQLPGAVYHGAEDGVDVGGGAPDRGEHLARREELFFHLGELGPQTFNSGVIGAAVLTVDVHDGPFHGAAQPYAAPARAQPRGATRAISLLWLRRTSQRQFVAIIRLKAWAANRRRSVL
jgi:hypothetical protein